MKAFKLSLVIMAAAILTIGISGMAYAFHSGGVAECEGCHSMHSPVSTSYLLVAATQSETCLTCHEHAGDTGPSSYHVSTASGDMPGTGNAMLPPKQRGPAGDFGWIRKTYTWGTGTGDVEDGSTHGHNVVAAVNGYVVDPVNSTSPGGSYAANQLACNSCHDPHGQFRRLANNTIARTGGAIWASGSYSGTANEPKTVGSEALAVGVYRLLAGSGYTKSGVAINFPGVPPAKAPSNYNRSEATTQTRVAYGTVSTNGHTTWSQWCSTCHANMHMTGVSKHPTERDLGSTIANLYNQYKKSGDMSGSVGSSYLSIVPFTKASAADYSTLNTLAQNNDSQLGGPLASDQVSCVSCHRSHASAWPHMLRFSYGYEFVTKNGEYVATDNPDFPNWGSRGPAQAQGRTVADMRAGHYDRPATMWSAYQRVLCNKCHAKD
jgi:predicted CXXCH cytochrome family protein